MKKRHTQYLRGAVVVILLWGAGAVYAQDGSAASPALDTGSLIVAGAGVLAVLVSGFVIWRSLRDPVTPTNRTVKRRTQEMRVAPPKKKETNTPDVRVSQVEDAPSPVVSDDGEDDVSVLILVLVESHTDWLRTVPYQWEVLPEETPFFIGSTINRTSSMDLDIGIPDERISGNHIRIDYNEDIQRFTFTDLNSFNGSVWDMDPMEPERPYILQTTGKKMLEVAHNYKFTASTMSRAALSDLNRGSGEAYPSFMNDQDLDEVLGGAGTPVGPTSFEGDVDTFIEGLAKDSLSATGGVPKVSAPFTPTEAIPYNQLGDFEEDTYRSMSDNSAPVEPKVHDLPDRDALPKHIEAYLIWQDSERDHTKLLNTVVTIGSSDKADITLANSEVSDTHLILTWRNDHFWLMDVSRSGTWLQKGKGRQTAPRRMPAKEPQQLKAGVPYIIDVGHEVANFTFQYKEIVDAARDIAEPDALPQGVTPYLHIVREDENDHRRDIDVQFNKITIGRYDDSHVSLIPETISRSHAEIEWRDGAFAVRDMNSRGGTNLNQEPLIDNEWHTIVPDEIHEIILSPGQREVLIEFCYKDEREITLAESQK